MERVRRVSRYRRAVVQIYVVPVINTEQVEGFESVPNIDDQQDEGIKAFLKEEIMKCYIANLCLISGLWYGKVRPWGQFFYKDIVTMILGRLPSNKVYQQFLLEYTPTGTLQLKSFPLPATLPDINTILNNPKRSGDIIVTVDHNSGKQFSSDVPHADNLSIPFIVNNMRIPFSEWFGTMSTHGGIETMENTLTLVGKSIPQNLTISTANVVDIAPTILNILGVPIPALIDGEPLRRY